MPSIWREPFATREEARKAAVAELLEGIETLGPRDGKAMQQSLRHIKAELQQLKPRQQMMFE